MYCICVLYVVYVYVVYVCIYSVYSVCKQCMHSIYILFLILYTNTYIHAYYTHLDKTESTNPDNTARNFENLRTELDNKIILVNKQINKILSQENNIQQNNHTILYENSKNKERIHELKNINKLLIEQNMNLLNNNIYIHNTNSNNHKKDDNSISLEKDNYQDIIVQLASQITKVEELVSGILSFLFCLCIYIYVLLLL